MREVAAVAVLHDNHILMGRRRESQKWTNPGGHLNPGEDPVKGAMREVREETGISLPERSFVHMETRIVTKPSGEKIKVHGYKVSLPMRLSTTVLDDGDHEVKRWVWVSLDKDLSHISGELHVPIKDNVLLLNVLKNKVLKKHRFLTHSRLVGESGFYGKIR